MGHMNVTASLVPLDSRVGCEKHEKYDADCLACWVLNGGGND